MREALGSPLACAVRVTFHADGADMALIQVEVVDKDGKRCPLDNRTVQFTLNGHAEWRGGIAQGENNHILDTNLPVECGINRALIRSTTTAEDRNSNLQSLLQAPFPM